MRLERFYCSRRLARYRICNPRDLFYLICYTSRHFIEYLMRYARPVSGHSIYRADYANCNNSSIPSLISDDSYSSIISHQRVRLPYIIVQTSRAELIFDYGTCSPADGKFFLRYLSDYSYRKTKVLEPILQPQKNQKRYSRKQLPWQKIQQIQNSRPCHQSWINP